jgi:hypothetical protein
LVAAYDLGERSLARARQPIGVVVGLGMAEVKEAEIRAVAAPGNEPLGPVDEQGASGLERLEAVTVNGLVGRRRARVLEPTETYG